MKLGFVILNYNGDQTTINCVDSLLKLYPNQIICIVDNFSQDKPIDNIVEKYKDCSNVKILKAEKNYGYAVGNNIGINYLREMGVEYIAVVNNDTIFQNGSLIESIKNIDSNVGVISLELDNVDGTKQSPYGIIKKPVSTYLKIGIRQILIFMGVYLFFRRVKEKISGKKHEDSPKINYDEFDYIVSGAAFILTPSFFEHYTQLFNKTFLYCEEHITALYLKKAKLKTKVILDTKIIHLESQTATFSSRKKLKRAHQSWWQGLRVLLKSKKGIRKHFSDKNYKCEILKD